MSTQMFPTVLYKFKAAEKLEKGDYVSVDEEGRIAKAKSISTTDGIAMAMASRRGALVQILVGVFTNNIGETLNGTVRSSSITLEM